MVVVAVRDNCARRFLGVQFFVNDETACRDFANSVLLSRDDKQSVLGTNPEDFSLWHLAEYTETEGFFEPQEHYVLMSAVGVLAEIDHIKGGEADA